MKCLIVLALALSGCATTDTRQVHWTPVDKAGKTMEGMRMDYATCLQIAETVNPRQVARGHAACMLSRGYVQVVFAEDK